MDKKQNVSFGYFRVAAAVPKVKIANPEYNAEQILSMLDEMKKEQPDLIVFPELCLTGYSCGELFVQKSLQDSALAALGSIIDHSKNIDAFIAVGSIANQNQSLYNCAFIIYKGKLLGVVPKIHLPNKNEYYDKRWFVSGRDISQDTLSVLGFDVPFGNLVFSASDDSFTFAAEICEDLWAPVPPSSFLYLNGAELVINLSASNALVAKSDYRRALISQQSARFNGAYLYCSAGVYESTTDYVMDGQAMVAENGTILKESERFERTNQYIVTDIDPEALRAQRIRNASFCESANHFDLSGIRSIIVPFKIKKKTTFKRYIDPAPFVPSSPENKDLRCKEIFAIQTAGLAKRMEHTGIKKAVLGISGGLDSTLAFLVTVKTFELLQLPMNNIIAVTMPGFGTTDTTYQNSLKLIQSFGTTLLDIDIKKSSLLHFEMIGHDPNDLDVTYENVQARERTAILMNLANKHRGLVIGTGDLSELALGWCTYNGDHMSMYAVNNSVPKTLVRHLVRWNANQQEKKIADVLYSIIGTPISPELLPKGADGRIEQKTEDILGPYEVHDFFLFHFIKHGFDNEKILFISKEAFKEKYSDADLEKWLAVFYRRFFSQQFKRSCIPDGPKVGSISLSPRADWKMPSDADPNIWLK